MQGLAQASCQLTRVRDANSRSAKGWPRNRTKYAYDANGNATSRQGSTITWASYNYPTTVNAGNGSTAETASFSYGPFRQRWQQSYVGNSTQETTNYVGGLLEVVATGSATTYRHYIYAGAEPVAVYSRQSNGTNTFDYLLSDHQASLASITNSSGVQVVGESFTPFGNRRNPTTWSGAASNSDLTTAAGITRQGYTFQTQLGLWTGMNHMNGRVEDAVTGRMLSADPSIPDPTNVQDYNRYSYVDNNPLSYSDPSGFDGCSNSPPPASEGSGSPMVADISIPENGMGVFGDYSSFNVIAYTTITVWGCDPFSRTISDPTQIGDFLRDNTALIQPAMTEQQLAQIVVQASKRLHFNWNLPFPEEQMWAIDMMGILVDVPTTATTVNCNGVTAGQSRPTDPNFSSMLSDGVYQAVVHTHPFWAYPFPGPEDGVIPSGFGIPNFGISPSGVWEVSPGPPLSLDLLSGSWGGSFSPSSYNSRINNPGSGGRQAQCH